ncbi:MAG: TIGR01459 family HAD-type hydrolase [Roseinatronobacter sp.]
MQRLDSLLSIAPRFGAIVLDQWGVLHDGSAAYPRAVDCLARLTASGCVLAVLSNSGKRAAPNLQRIARMGFAPQQFACVMTSGEALWQDLASGRVSARHLCPIEAAPGDAAAWAAGLDVTLTHDPHRADAILLMGLPDDAAPDAYGDLLDTARARKLPVLCTNPDRRSPRAGGQQVVAPGTLAHAHAARAGDVRFYGKPHLPVFRAVQTALGRAPEQVLMVGDSLEHDIAGARAAGWKTVLIEGGLHADTLRNADPDALDRLARREAAPLPDFTLPELC